MRKPAEIWERFAALPGAIHDGHMKIASQHAIDGLMKIITTYRPATVLEVGSGIGTLTFAALETAKSLGFQKPGGFRLVSVESHPFCAEERNKNLSEFEGMYETLVSTDDLAPELTFDLIVVDAREQVGMSGGTKRLNDLLNPSGVIFIEGQRTKQRRWIAQSYQDREFVYGRMPSLRKYLNAGELGSRNPRFKGYHIFKFEPEFSDRVSVLGNSFVKRKCVKAIRLMHPSS